MVYLKKHFYIFIFFNFLLNSVIAQEISLKREIDKFTVKQSKSIFINQDIKNKPAFILYFENCSYDETDFFLPYYQELVKLPGNSYSVSIKINTQKKLDPALIHLIDDINSVPAVPVYTFFKSSIRKEGYVEVRFPPFLRDSATGEISRVTDFEIILTKTFNPSPESLKLSGNMIPGNSVLSQGKWVKLRIKESGIYKLMYNELIDMGLEPGKIRVFGNGGRTIPVMNKQQHNYELVENAIWFEKGSDGIFNEGDYILFYGEGPVTWSYDKVNELFVHQLHIYDEYSYYFLSSGAESGKQISMIEPPTKDPDNIIDNYDIHFYHEIESENLIRSGKSWFEPMSPVVPFKIDFPVTDLISSLPGKIKLRTAARSPLQSNFQLSEGGKVIDTYIISSVNMSSYTSNYARANTIIREFLPSSDKLDVDVRVLSGNSQDARFWIDYLDINAKRELIVRGGQMPFRNANAVEQGFVNRFNLRNMPADAKVWDITDMYNIKEVETQLDGNILYFDASADSLREYLAWDLTSFLIPELVEENVPNQNLIATGNIDMLIVVPEEFLDAAQRLTDFHISNDQLEVKLVTAKQVYNEFSSGAKDAGAIRNYMKILYDRAPEGKLPKYLLLFGDGSFDNRSMHENNSNFLPTYQSENSLVYTQSYVTDDFYGLLDDNEGGSLGLLDIGIGRFPARTVDEANIIVDKVIRYTEKKSFGSWRNRLCFIGDDEDNNIHTRDANILCDYIEANYPSFNIHKVFLDSYEQVSTPTGESYPDVNKIIYENIQNGLLIFNYIGHGSERGLAHENILGINDINSWTNTYKLPLFVTATCEFSRFDDIDRDIYGEINGKISAGELVLLNPEGGGIGLLTTTRLVYSSPNFVLNRNFYKHIFETDADGNRLRLGDVMRLTKNESGGGINKRNFTLLGDPALVLSYPEHFIVTDSVNGRLATEFADTLKGLGEYSISGHIADRSGNTMRNFSTGIVEPIVFDKESTIKTLGNDPGSPVMEFQVRDKTLYKGKVSVKDGLFNMSFTIPKDISFKPGQGKISYYFLNDSKELDAQGYFNDFYVGGFSDMIKPDTDGPVIQLFLNDSLFISGGISSQFPEIYAQIYDESGINTLGTGIGHDIIAYLDDDYNSPFVLNSYYEADMDSYKSGTLLYPLPGLSEGKHRLTLKAWDTYNNSSVASIEFQVTNSEIPVVRNLFNYPNPFHEGTSFILEHNMADTELDVQINIYNLSGQIIKTIKNRYYSSGYRLGPVEWDGKTDSGRFIDEGMYFYQVIINNPDETISVINSKMIKIK